MRLRVRLMVLVAVLLAGVLGGSFAWLFADLRTQYAKDLEASLGSATASFRAGETQRFRTLEVMAGSLEASPSFRNVLRQTDRATLIDFINSTAEGLQVDLIMLSDQQGALRAQAGKTAQHPSADVLQGWAGSTSALRHYWWLDGQLYQGASVPLVDSQDYIDGYISVAYRLDRVALDRLAAELDSKLELHERVPASRPEDHGYLWRNISLGEKHQAQLAIGRSLAPIEAIVGAARVKLLSLATVAFLAALAASYPLVGKIAHPLEALQQAQAEMAAIFSASLDGLVSFDHDGRVSAANPSAAVALGRPPSALTGVLLPDLLPDRVLRELATAPVGTHQHSNFERAGRLYNLHRTFVRAHQSMQLGSILLFHDITEERHRERRVTAFLAHLCKNLEVPDSPWRVRVGLATLSAWSIPAAASERESAQAATALADLVERFSLSLEPGRTCRLVNGTTEGELAAIAPGSWNLLVEILLDNALVHGQGEIVVSLQRVGGCLELAIEDQGTQAPTDLESCLQGSGLGLQVAQDLCLRHQGRLEIGPRPPQGTRALAVLPRGVC